MTGNRIGYRGCRAPVFADMCYDFRKSIKDAKTVRAEGNHPAEVNGKDKTHGTGTESDGSEGSVGSFDPVSG